MDNFHILLIDDELEFHRDISFAMRRHFSFDKVMDLNKLDEKINNPDRKIDAVFLDLVFDNTGEKKGLKLISKIQVNLPYAPIIIVTADSQKETVREALRLGAADYFRKNEDDYEIWEEKLRHLISSHKVNKENIQLKKKVKELEKEKEEDGSFVGKTPVIKEIKRTLKILGEDPDLTILIAGETGVGKEVAAEYLVKYGQRKDKPFNPINLSAISNTLIESELFGHTKGSFSGATQNRKGLFSETNGGTILLDEIGDIAIPIQIKLLRIIQEKKIRPVGANKDIKLDIQILSATHQDLDQAIFEGRFREDLYQRLTNFIVTIPPLRERIDDLPRILQFFLKKEYGLNLDILDNTTLQTMMAYHWPGNIRELINCMKKMLLSMKIKNKSKVEPICLPKKILYPDELNGASPQIKALLSEEPKSEITRLTAITKKLSSAEEKALVDIKRIAQATKDKNGVKKDIAIVSGFKNSDALRYRLKVLNKKFPELFVNFPVVKNCYPKIFKEK